MNKILNIPSEEIIKDYINGNCLETIAKKYNCSSNYIRYTLIKNNIKRRVGHIVSEKQKQWNRDKFTKIFNSQQINKIIKDYTIRHLSLKKIGIYFDCSSGPIVKVLKNNNIKIRSSWEESLGKKTSLENRIKGKMGRLRSENLKHGIDMNKLGSLYLNEKITCRELAKMFNVNIHTIVSRLDSLNIKRETYSEMLKRKWRDPVFRKNRAAASIKAMMVRPTSFERRISELCIKNNLPFIYTGDGRFLINYKNPDFIDEKNKIVIEVFHSYYKIRDYGSVENYMNFCRNKYESAGWKVIFIDENEVHLPKNWEQICLKKIQEHL